MTNYTFTGFITSLFGWLCLNCDYSKVVGCGGLVKNSNDDWLADFSKYISFCDSFVAEV